MAFLYIFLIPMTSFPTDFGEKGFSMIYHIKQMILELMFIEQRIFVSVSEALILKS